MVIIVIIVVLIILYRISKSPPDTSNNKNNNIYTNANDEHMEMEDTELEGIVLTLLHILDAKYSFHIILEMMNDMYSMGIYSNWSSKNKEILKKSFSDFKEAKLKFEKVYGLGMVSEKLYDMYDEMPDGDNDLKVAKRLFEFLSGVGNDSKADFIKRCRIIDKIGLRRDYWYGLSKLIFNKISDSHFNDEVFANIIRVDIDKINNEAFKEIIGVFDTIINAVDEVYNSFFLHA